MSRRIIYEKFISSCGKFEGMFNMNYSSDECHLVPNNIRFYERKNIYFGIKVGMFFSLAYYTNIDFS